MRWMEPLWYDAESHGFESPLGQPQPEKLGHLTQQYMGTFFKPRKYKGSKVRQMVSILHMLCPRYMTCGPPLLGYG